MTTEQRKRFSRLSPEHQIELKQLFYELCRKYILEQPTYSGYSGKSYRSILDKCFEMLDFLYNDDNELYQTHAVANTHTSKYTDVDADDKPIFKQ